MRLLELLFTLASLAMIVIAGREANVRSGHSRDLLLAPRHAKKLSKLGHPHPDKEEPGNAEPGKGEPAKGEPRKGEPAKAEPGKGEPGKGDKEAGNNKGAAPAGVLEANVVQNASQHNGNAANATGQTPSATDLANFINFCNGSALTNGTQVEAGSCNSIPMGKIPAKKNMISSIIMCPQNGAKIPAGKEFKLQAKVSNLAAGNFTNPESTYYSAPQDLNSEGKVMGHLHFTIQNTGGDLNPQEPLDPIDIQDFKAVNTAADPAGLLSVSVENGVPAGNYRVCTLIAASNHQPVIMPVARRGAQDDCIRFTAE
ncbi:hypothetical protein QQS21_012470 [Conoideocrella luteorostrata]|uniref:Ribosomal protein s17 n=1 Tax=Conoideocrella luteorostrata TaxID=1105319 RepID=A0AAJ0CDG2_9HYPO|nr:hypothetical protein QQS21_012470 [Conoideocrella luteorostrata]